MSWRLSTSWRSGSVRILRITLLLFTLCAGVYGLRADAARTITLGSFQVRESTAILLFFLMMVSYAIGAQYLQRRRLFVRFETGFAELVETMESLVNSEQNVVLYRLMPYEFNSTVLGSGVEGKGVTGLVDRYRRALGEFVDAANLDDYTIYGCPRDLDKVEGLVKDINDVYFSAKDDEAPKSQTTVAWSPAVRGYWLFLFHNASVDQPIAVYLFKMTELGELPTVALASRDRREIELGRWIFKTAAASLDHLSYSVSPSSRKSITGRDSEEGFERFKVKIMEFLSSRGEESVGLQVSQDGEFRVEKFPARRGEGSLAIRLKVDQSVFEKTWPVSSVYTDVMPLLDDLSGGNAEVKGVKVEEGTVSIAIGDE